MSLSQAWSRRICRDILKRRLPACELFTSQSLLDELAEKMRDKFGLDPAELPLLKIYEDTATVVKTKPLPQPVCRDGDDDEVLAVALAARVEIILTGDKDLLVLKEFQGIKISRPVSLSSGWTRGSDLSHRLRRDVAAEMRAVEMDFLHGGVGGGLRGFQILAQRRHAEDAAAVGDDLAVLQRRAGVENFRVRQFRRLGQAEDRLALRDNCRDNRRWPSPRKRSLPDSISIRFWPACR